MKKNILFIAAALFLYLGNQSVIAQTKTKMKTQTQTTKVESFKESAKKRTEGLVRSLELNEKQEQKVYALLLTTEEKKSMSDPKLDDEKRAALDLKMEKYILRSMKEILSEEQFKKYFEMAKKL